MISLRSMIMIDLSIHLVAPDDWPHDPAPSITAPKAADVKTLDPASTRWRE